MVAPPSCSSTMSPVLKAAPAVSPDIRHSVPPRGDDLVAVLVLVLIVVVVVADCYYY